MKIQEFKNKSLKSFFWKFIEVFFVNFLQITIYIILARILLPEEFGLVAIVFSIIGITNIFVSGGLSAALIQRDDINEKDYSTVLIFSVLLSISLYILLYIFSKDISTYYNEPLIESILKIGSLTLIFNSYTNVQKAFFQRNMEFKILSNISIMVSLFAGLISIASAYNGLGVYSLIINQVLGSFFTFLFLFHKTKWLPKFNFDFNRFKEIISYSSHILFNNIIDNIYINIFPLVIGKLYSVNTLGFYNNGRQFPSLLASTINSIISSVSFSLFSRIQNNKVVLRKSYIETLLLSNFCIFPLMFLLNFVSNDLILLIFTEKWIYSVKYLKLFCFLYAIHHYLSIFITFLNAIGKSRYSLIYNSKIKFFSLLFSLPFAFYSIDFLLYALILSSVITTYVVCLQVNKYLKLELKNQIMISIPYLFCSFVAYILVVLIDFSIDSVTLRLLLNCFFYFLFYAFFNYILKTKIYLQILNQLINSKMDSK